MEGYYYHGIEFYPGSVGDTVKKMVKIMDEGLITRCQAGNYEDSNYNHVCLYRKNYNYDYNLPDTLVKSARGGWIDGQFVFIIDGKICAVKTDAGIETDLIDEWRYPGNILPSNFVGIALPFDTINSYLRITAYDEECKLEQETIKTYLPILLEKAIELGMVIVDSNRKNFTDEMDMSLISTQNTEQIFFEPSEGIISSKKVFK